jgi:lipopolysaccharide cholinephosphotransferase
MRRELTDLRELQLIELDILIFFDDYCRKNGLRYYLCGGTLLGAVRHKGFIPWDDDVDVAMPRPDYDKMIEDSKKWKRYRLLCPENDINSPKIFGKLLDTRTHSEAEHFEGIDYGVFLDIFPIDGCGDDYEEAAKQAKKILYLCGRFEDTSFRYELTGNSVKRAGKSVLRRFANRKKVYEKLRAEATKVPFDGAKYRGCVCGGLRGLDEMLVKDGFDKIVDAEFEGHRFMIPEHYEIYLTMMYKDFMKLPPESEQVATHPAKIWIEEGEE